jgi:exosortase
MKPSSLHYEWPIFAGWTGLLIAWVSLFSRTSLWWNEASYYTHGWCVSFLTLVLLARRRADWPLEENQSRASWLMPLALAILLLLPARLLGEPDPFWRIPLWLEMISLSVLSFCFVSATRLRVPWQAWTLASAYLLTCLPWPATLESTVVHSLASLVTSFTAETLLWFGHPAEALGNAILVDQQTVSIDQACSGIRSLQSLFSFALFFSIYFRHDWLRALVNFSSAIVFALIFNSLRALTLSIVFLEHGRNVQENWHDAIGNTFIISSMICLALTSRALADKTENEAGKEDVDKPLEPKPRIIPWSFASAFVLPEILIFAWFALLPNPPEPFSWEISLGTHGANIPDGVHDVLLFDYGEQGEIPLDENSRASVIHFGYEEDSAAASLCSRNHDPETCMQYTGVRLLDSDALVRYEFQGNELLFRHYTTPPKEPQGAPDFHVFWCSAVLDSRIDSFEFQNPSPWAKARRFLSGKLSYERKVLLISLSGKRTLRKAESDLAQVLRAILRPAKESREISSKVPGPLQQRPLLR